MMETLRGGRGWQLSYRPMRPFGSDSGDRLSSAPVPSTGRCCRNEDPGRREDGPNPMAMFAAKDRYSVAGHSIPAGPQPVGTDNTIRPAVAASRRPLRE